jgi:Phage tail protein (Tail_P2_I)
VSVERLYALLPALHRRRDAAIGSPLRALLAVLDGTAGALEADIARLYENWFVETCDEWVVPYLADLVGVQALNPVAARTNSQRAYVANVLAYRRRKGTAAMLEQLAQDLTDWAAHATEFFQLLSTTQHLNHPRLENVRTPDLRRDALLGLLGGPFEAAAHTGEVRRIASGRGRYGIHHVGLFLWRLDADPVSGADAAPAADRPGESGFFRFSPLGQDEPLFNRRHVEEDVSSLSTEDEVPGPLRRRALLDDLDAFQAVRARLGSKAPLDSLYFGTRPVLSLSVDGTDLPVEAMCVCDLADWSRPPDVVPIEGMWPAGSVAVDPLLGRIAFAKSVAPATPPQASHHRGWPGALGGGGYPRPAALPASAPPVTGGGGALATLLGSALPFAPISADDQQKRIDALRTRAGREPEGGTQTPMVDRLAALLGLAGQSCIVEIGDSRTYSLSAVSVPAGSVLEIRAADGQRPLVALQDPASITLGQQAVLILSGLLVSGKTLAVAQAPEAAIALEHTTLVPGLALGPDGAPATPGALSVDGPTGPGRFDLLLYRSISGPLRVSGTDGYVFLEDSIVDATTGALPALAAAHAALARATVLGAASVEVLDLASDAIFTGLVTAQRVQEGCVRFSFVPDGSRAPQPYRCQPALALQTWAATPDPKPAREVLLSRIVPSFTSRRYGAPGYAQLTPACAPEVRRGASDEGAMGAWSFLQEPQREDNLRTSLNEYLRFGLEAGLIFVT